MPQLLQESELFDLDRVVAAAAVVAELNGLLPEGSENVVKQFEPWHVISNNVAF